VTNIFQGRTVAETVQCGPEVRVRIINNTCIILLQFANKPIVY